MVVKKKKPAIFTSEEDLAPFGFKMHDIVRTPLGITGQVIGVKYENPDSKETARVWVKYENGHEAPLEPKLGAGYMSQLGYRRCNESDHIWRDVKAQQEQQKKVDEQLKIVAEVKYCIDNKLPIPQDLLPKGKKEKKKKDGDKKKKK